MGEVEIRPARERDLAGLLPLFAGYQRFYRAHPDDDRNRAFISRFLSPSDHGVLLGAWDGDDAVGFACVYWTFSSTRAAPIGLLNDLFVQASHRGGRIGERLIRAAAAAARERGMASLEWYTAPDNTTAQRLYERTGAARSEWVAYELDL